MLGVLGDPNNLVRFLRNKQVAEYYQYPEKIVWKAFCHNINPAAFDFYMQHP